MGQRHRQKPIRVRKSISLETGGISSWLTIRELTDAYPISRGWIRARLDDGRIESRQSGKTVLVDFKSFLTAYEESQYWLDIVTPPNVY